MATGENDDRGSLEALVAERNLLASELAERTEQLRAVIRELHGANQQLARLRDPGQVGPSSIDWSTILDADGSAARPAPSE